MMKLGTQTGSLINHLYSATSADALTPTVGMAATVLSWTDRSAATVSRVFRIGRDVAVQVQRDTATRTDTNGHSESQTYTYAPNPDAYRDTFRNVRGLWVAVELNSESGRYRKVGHGGLLLGTRETYRDPSF